MATVDVKEPARKPQNSMSWLGGATGPLIGLILLCLFLAFASDKFLSVRNGLNILDQITVIGIMAVGMTYVILIGGIDLSVGSVLALSMMIMGWVANVAGYPMGVAFRSRFSPPPSAASSSAFSSRASRCPPSSRRLP